MIITSYFQSQGIPATGLSPSLTAYRLDTNAVVLNAVTMSEVANGIYKYDFLTYDQDLDYAIYVDGGASLDNNDRYQYGDNSNEVWSSASRSLTAKETGDILSLTAEYNNGETDVFRLKTKTV